MTGYIRPERAAEAKSAPKPDFEEEKRKILAQAKADQALQQVLAEIQGIRDRLDERPAAATEADDHETIRRIDALLALNDFSESFRREAVARLRRDFSLEALGDVEEVESAALEWVGDSIRLWPGPKEQPSQGATPDRRGPRILALVGPTGVGKTTTIAKLAAIHAVGIGGGTAPIGQDDHDRQLPHRRAPADRDLRGHHGRPGLLRRDGRGPPQDDRDAFGRGPRPRRYRRQESAGTR